MGVIYNELSQKFITLCLVLLTILLILIFAMVGVYNLLILISYLSKNKLLPFKAVLLCANFVKHHNVDNDYQAG